MAIVSWAKDLRILEVATYQETQDQEVIIQVHTIAADRAQGGPCNLATASGLITLAIQNILTSIPGGQDEVTIQVHLIAAERALKDHCIRVTVFVLVILVAQGILTSIRNDQEEATILELTVQIRWNEAVNLMAEVADTGLEVLETVVTPTVNDRVLSAQAVAKGLSTRVRTNQEPLALINLEAAL